MGYNGHTRLIRLLGAYSSTGTGVNFKFLRKQPEIIGGHIEKDHNRQKKKDSSESK